jgi:HSP20 family protein
MDDVSNRLSRLFDESLFSARGDRWVPPVTVSESTGELVLTAELPGLRREDISIDLENSVLVISGQKAELRAEGDEDRRYHVQERHFGSFSRSFTLPRTIDAAKIVATFDSGVLTVKLPKVSEAQGRKIEIAP